MLIDFRGLPDGVEIDSDVCIIGAGPAGIAVARSLMGRNLSICLIESGGEVEDRVTRTLSEGEMTGASDAVGLADSRQRCFGGSSASWGGGCAPMAAGDYHERPDAPGSAWPIDAATLEPFYRRARKFCRLDRPGLRVTTGALPAGEDPLALDGDVLTYIPGVSSPIHFGETYGPELDRDAGTRVLLHANVMELRTDAGGHVVQSARLRSLRGNEATIRASCFVLAGGGIENARLLLLSDGADPQGLGNRHDQVGRYFMDHPRARIGVLPPLRRARAASGSGQDEPGLNERGLADLPHFGLTEAAREAGGLPGARFRLSFAEDFVPRGVAAFRELAHRIRWRQPPRRVATALAHTARHAHHLLPAAARRLAGRPVVARHHVDCLGFFEQLPNPDSRIVLGEKRDALGQRQARLEWRFMPSELDGYVATARLLQQQLARGGAGRLRLDPWAESGADVAASLIGNCHHLGTTRMSADPRFGVVDADARVHGVANLYVAGSSVFPNGGCYWPTFTIVALALRLADHIGGLLAGDARPASSRVAAAVE